MWREREQKRRRCAWDGFRDFACSLIPGASMRNINDILEPPCELDVHPHGGLIISLQQPLLCCGLGAHLRLHLMFSSSLPPASALQVSLQAAAQEEAEAQARSQQVVADAAPLMAEASRLQASSCGALDECLHWTQQHLRALALIR